MTFWAPFYIPLKKIRDKLIDLVKNLLQGHLSKLIDLKCKLCHLSNVPRLRQAKLKKKNSFQKKSLNNPTVHKTRRL